MATNVVIEGQASAVRVNESPQEIVDMIRGARGEVGDWIVLTKAEGGTLGVRHAEVRRLYELAGE